MQNLSQINIRKLIKTFLNKLIIIIELLLKSPSLRKLLFIIVDSINILSSLLVSNWFLKYNYSITTIYLYTLPCAIFLFIFTGQYKGLSRYVGSPDLYKISFRNFGILIIQLIILNKSFNSQILKLLLLNFLIFTLLTGIFRFLLRDLLRKFYYDNKNNIKNKKKAFIYGAGSAGAQLAASIKHNNGYQICGFLDDDLKLEGRELSGYKIYNPKNLKVLIKKLSINEILLAIPSVSKGVRSRIIKKFTKLGVKILQIPSLDEIHKGSKQIEFLREIEIEDLLQRESVAPNENLINKEIKNRIICVTGAGGSIGSELCSQILKYNPKKLILIEISEINLYKTEMLLTKNFPNLKECIEPNLGSLSNLSLLKNIFEKNQIDIIFHAAAYKHVPLLEFNPLQAIKNNIFNTKTLCEFSKKYKIKHMVMISTDKAVRPTNVMGATKRVAEIIVQGFAKESKNKITESINALDSYTNFSIVRFGNVLGSSGSVVPMFQEQINQGGPITLTHPEIIRYFMSVKEAVELVLQAAALEKNGDILLLDMGKPVKIIDLAKQMISLNGLSIKDKKNKNGDIEIIYVGLRPGEKLYEELLIDKKSQKTEHPLIYRGIESAPNLNEINDNLQVLEKELYLFNKNNCLKLLKKIVPEWEDQQNY